MQANKVSAFNQSEKVRLDLTLGVQLQKASVVHEKFSSDVLARAGVRNLAEVAASIPLIMAWRRGDYTGE